MADERFCFDGDLFFWRGPAPFFFIAVPDPHRSAIHELSPRVTYGWGMIPATVTIGDHTWETALFPKDGGYLVPVKKAFRVAAEIDEGDTVGVTLIVAT